MICQGYLMHWESIGCIVIVCSYVPLSERYSGHAPSSTYHELILPALQWIFIAFDEMPVVHQSTRSLVHFALTRAVVTYCSSLRVRVFLLFFIGRHCETHLLSLHRIPKNFLLFLLLSFFLSFFIQVSRLNLNARAFSARVVWLSTDRALCWNPFLSSCFNQSELTPLSYFMRGDFFLSASPFMQMILAASTWSSLQEGDIGFDGRANPATFTLTRLSCWRNSPGWIFWAIC